MWSHVCVIVIAVDATGPTVPAKMVTPLRYRKAVIGYGCRKGFPEAEPQIEEKQSFVPVTKAL